MALSLGAALRERYVDSNANNSAEVCSSKLFPIHGQLLRDW